MASKTFSSLKIKVTASLDADLVKAIDGYLKESKARSRSQLIEDVIRSWLMEQKKRKLEDEMEQYYLSLSEGERKEDQEWTDIAAQSIHHPFLFSALSASSAVNKSKTKICRKLPF